MEVERRVFNVLGRPPVVVDHRHPVARLQQLYAFHHVGAVGVHHDQQRAGAHLQKRLIGGRKDPGILRQATEPVQHRPGGVVFQIDDHLGLLAPLAGHTAKACCGAHGVHVREAVAHDIKLRGVRHQLAEGIGHDPGLDLGPLFRGLAAAAVEGKVHLAPDHRLVAAPAESHLQRQIGVLVQLSHAVGVLADADREGRRHVAHLDVPDGVQHGELVLREMLVVALLKNEEVVVPLGFQQQPVGAGGPDVELFVDLGQHGAAGRVGAGLHQILVVIHHQHRQHGAGAHVPLPQLVGVGGIHPVGGGHQVLLAAPALGPDQRAVHPEAAAVHAHPVRAFLLALQQPLHGKLRHRVLHLHFKEVFPHAGQLQKVLIAPDDLAGVRPEHHDRQRGVDEGGFAGGVHAAGEAVDVLQNALAALLVGFCEVGIQRHDHSSLRQRQQRTDHSRRTAEEHHAQKVQLQVRFQQAGEFFIIHETNLL